MSGRSALIVGATGATGKHLLRHLLSTPEYTTIGEYGRRVTSVDDIATGKDKLEQHQIDFDKLGETDDQGLKAKQWDTVFITLGTTRAAAGSAETFEKIDREYVIAAAKAAKSPDANVKQRLVYLSSQGSNINSSFLFPKSKGLTEQALAGLGYSDTIVFRPGFLANAERASGRLGEQIIEPFMKGISYFGSLSSKMQIPVSTLGQAIARAGTLGSSGLPTSVQTSKAGSSDAQFTVIDNTAALALAASAS